MFVVCDLLNGHIALAKNSGVKGDAGANATARRSSVASHGHAAVAISNGGSTASRYRESA